MQRQGVADVSATMTRSSMPMTSSGFPLAPYGGVTTCDGSSACGAMEKNPPSATDASMVGPDMRVVSNPAVMGRKVLNPGTFSIELPPLVSTILPSRFRRSLTAEMMHVVSGLSAMVVLARPRDRCSEETMGQVPFHDPHGTTRKPAGTTASSSLAAA